MNQSVLVQSLPIIAKAIGRNMGVRVEVDAERAQTDGEVIYLPSLPLNDPGVETLGLGLTVHESGHIRYSDFSDVFKAELNKLPPFARALAGAMEDPRMEQCVIRDYPGAQKRFDDLVTKLVGDGFFKPVSAKDSPNRILNCYVLYRLRAYFLGQEALTMYADQARTLLQNLMTHITVTRIDSVIARVLKARNELEILQLANEVATVLEEESKRERPQTSPDNQANDDDSQGNAGDADNDLSNHSGADKSGEVDSDQNSAKHDQQGDDQGNSGSSDSETGVMSQEDFEKAQQAMRAILESDDDTVEGDLSSAFNSLVSQEINKAESRGNYVVNTQANHVSTLLKPTNNQEALDEAQAVTSALRTRMTRLVQAQAKAKRKTSRYGRRLNDRRLSSIPTGNTSVFQSVSKKKAVNTAVQVLTDVSWSMQDSIKLAMRSALSITAALDSVPHLSVGTALFPGINNWAATVLTGFGDSVKQTAGFYPSVQADGCTPLLPALVWSGDQLVAQKKDRKILIVITDGGPDSKEACIDMIACLRRGGIEVYGLGMEVDQKLMTEVFGREFSEVIESDQDLAQATFALLERTLSLAA